MRSTLLLLLLLLALPASARAQAGDTRSFRPVIRLNGAVKDSVLADTTRPAPAPARTPPVRTAAPKPRATPASALARATETPPAPAPAVLPAAPDTVVPDTVVPDTVVPMAVAATMAVPRESPPAAESVPAPAVTAAAAPPVVAPAASAVSSFAIKGLVGVTLFAQDRALGFGNGQSALWAKSQEITEDATVAGADVRNTRLGLSFSGGEITPGTRASGVLELDFFGGFNGSGPSSDEQPLPRLRLAYADVTRGPTMLRVGQFWSPLAGNVPVSASRIAFPLGLGSAGLIGWRNPGVLVQRSFGGARRSSLQAAVFRGSWTGAGDVLDHQSAGETSALPQVELRLDVASGTAWSAYAVGHVDGKDLNGAGPDTAGLGTLYGQAFAFGGKVTDGKLTLHGNGYVGRAIAQQMGQLAQFGDIGSVGGWVQAGYAFSGPWSAWFFAGADDPDDSEVFQAVAGDGRLKNRLYAAQLQYARGDYSAAVELVRPTTTWGKRVEGAVTQWERQGVQLAFSVVYRFSSEPPRPVVATAQAAFPGGATGK